MCLSKKHHYAPTLLAALFFLAAAVAIYPFDYSLSDSIRAFSRSVGKIHIFQEALNLFRPFGKGDVILVIIAGLGICGLRKRAAHIILALLIMSVLIWPFKLGVGRERPGYKNSHSFPSGDAATAAAFCMPLVTASPWSAPIAIVLNAGVATGRVYDGRHYPSDVLAGIAFGIIASAIAGAVLRRWPWKPRRRWFVIIGSVIILFSIVNLSWARATPFVLDFLRVWGPLGAFLILARLIPVWLRKRKTTGNPVRGFLILVFLGFTIYLSLTTASTLWDRDEPRFSRATVEMVESGNYLVPTFNNQLRPDKPILIYWLMSIPVRVLGVSELSCRLVAPIATLMTVLLTFWLARRLFDQKVAFWSGLILMLTPLMAVSGTAATTDALLLACITGAIASFMLSWLNGFRLWHLILLILSLSGAMLTKGPVGLAVPLLVMITVMIFARNGALNPWRYAGWLVFAIIASTLLFLSWGLPANAATNGEFLKLGIGKHVVSRSLTAMESHGGKSFAYYFYYVPVVILTFFPWILYLPRVFAQPTLWPDQGKDRARILFCWAVPIIILMSVVATKLPHYILPAWPALAMISALGLNQAIRLRRAGNNAPAAKIGLGLFITIGSTLGLGLMFAPWVMAKMPLYGIRVPATVLGLVFLSMTAVACHYYRKARHEYVASVLGGGMMVILLSASLFLLPAIERLKLSPMIAEVIQLNSAPMTPVATCGYGEPSLNFYLGRGPITPIEGPDLPKWATAAGQGVLVVTEARLIPQLAAFRTPRIETLDIIPGFNYSQGKQVRVHILFRNDTP
jgi:4-amino-4-deoxy-L-arabinose transferase-like glycosyltransferase/membrane-associated phospholipid phosphatase